MNLRKLNLTLPASVVQSCESRLISFTREVFSGYFSSVRSELIRVCDSLKLFVANPVAITSLQSL